MMRTLLSLAIPMCSFWCGLATPTETSLRGTKNATFPFVESDPLANQFPTLQEALEMARLSKLAYTFRNKEEGYCDSYSRDNGVKCEFYFHSHEIGTQVLIVSNHKEGYFAVVFAGTDDVRTSLEDVDIARKQFGDDDGNFGLQDPDIKVHAGFDNAVFANGLGKEIFSRIKKLKMFHPRHKLYTAGHSLGAANSILMATAFSLRGYSVKSISFGCPQTGNLPWRDYFNSTSPLKNRLGIWRVVLSWDLVPRLPEFFYHVGHTIQLWSEDHHKYDKHSPNLVEAYYEHYGSTEEGYAGVPAGWHAKPYVWVPGALTSHFMNTYLEHMEKLDETGLWVDGFKIYQPIGYDDDEYDEPPDDWVGMEPFSENDKLVYAAM